MSQSDAEPDNREPDNPDSEGAKPLRRQSLERTLRNNPTNLDAFNELAAIYRAENRPVEARKVLKQALDVFPDNVDLLFQYEEAILARSLQQLREVADLAKRLDTRETERELDRATRDWALRRIEVCRARLQRDDSSSAMHVQLGEAHFDAEQYDEAMEVLQRVTDRDDVSPMAHLLIGRCQSALGKELDAMASWRRAALRRGVVAPPAVRMAALKHLIDSATRLGLTETLTRYQSALSETQTTAVSETLAANNLSIEAPTAASPENS